MDLDSHRAVAPPQSALKVIDTYAFEVLLKRVARSFQLSLRILPSSIRSTLSLAYMLARASDSIADASSAPEFQRLALLRALPDFYPEKSPDLGLEGCEKDLVQRLPELLDVLKSLPDAPAIIEAWRVILRGQIFDLERFRSTEPGDPAPPLLPEELNEYTYLVAGSVGEFWTRLCFHHIPGYSSKSLEELLPTARRFGQALQLVNILRDRRTDERRALPGSVRPCRAGTGARSSPGPPPCRQTGIAPQSSKPFLDSVSLHDPILLGSF